MTLLLPFMTCGMMGDLTPVRPLVADTEILVTTSARVPVGRVPALVRWTQVLDGPDRLDSVTMPKWIAIGILGAILTFGVQSWWKASDQRDMLIELRTELRMAKEYEAERSKELKAQAELNKVYIDNMTGQLNVIKGMLSAQQVSAVEAAKRGTN